VHLRSKLQARLGSAAPPPALPLVAVSQFYLGAHNAERSQAHRRRVNERRQRSAGCTGRTMRDSWPLRAAISSTASCCRARLLRSAKDSPSFACCCPLLRRLCAACLSQFEANAQSRALSEQWPLQQAPAPASHGGGGLTTGQKWAIALGAVLFGMAVKVCEHASHMRAPCRL